MKGHGYGINFEDTFKLIIYWKEQFKLENHIKKLSEYPQFMTEINGLNIHYIKKSLRTEQEDDEKKDTEETQSAPDIKDGDSGVPDFRRFIIKNG